jgi:hypothetical protein
MPGTWVRAGTIFVVSDGRFYKFVEQTDDGWKAEEVKRDQVANPSQLTRIDELRSYYPRALASRDELDQKMRDQGDTPEARALLKTRDEELERLREELILLCNARTYVGRTTGTYSYDWRRPVLAGLGAVFLLSWFWCVRALMTFVPEQATTIIAGIVAVITGAILFVMGARTVAKHRNKLLQNNFVGCFALFTLAVVVITFAFLFFVVVRFFQLKAGAM